MMHMANIDDLRIDHPAPPTASGGTWRGIALGLIVLMLLGVLGFAWFWWTTTNPSNPATTTGHAQTTADSRSRDNQSSPAPVSAGTFTAGGYVEIVPPGPTAVTTRVDGWVLSVEVIEGQAVEAGQVLVTLDDATHRQAMAEAEADVALARARLERLRAGFRPEEIAEAEAQYRQAHARAEYARSQVERYEQLVQIGAAPSRQLQAARAELASAEAEVASSQSLLDLRRAGQRREDIVVAEAELSQAQTRLQRLRWQVDQCIVRAPSEGVVLQQFVRVGDWVAPTQERSGSDRPGGGSGVIASLFDPSQVQVWVEVNQRDAGRVSVDQLVTLRADALRDQTIHGRVSRIMPRANLQRNTVEVKIELIDADGNAATPNGLRPEMSVQVTFLPPEASTDQQGAN
jgi:HlyD family secretion protein